MYYITESFRPNVGDTATPSLSILPDGYNRKRDAQIRAKQLNKKSDGTRVYWVHEPDD